MRALCIKERSALLLVPGDVYVVGVPRLVHLVTERALVLEVGEVHGLDVVEHVVLRAHPLVAAQRAHVHVRIVPLRHHVGPQALACKA